MNTSNILSIAQTTYREAARQPVFWVLLSTFGALILISGEITLFSLGDEQLMVREMGLSSIALCTFLLILLTATNAIHGEMESQTLLTLLSKPVDRASVLLGKLAGVLWAGGGALLFLALTLVLTLWFNGGISSIERTERRERYEARRVWIQLAREHAPDAGLTVPDVQRARLLPGARTHLAPPQTTYTHKVVTLFLPTLEPLAQGLYLLALQCVVLAAIAACLSIRFGFHLTATLSFVVFTVGNLSTYLHDRMVGQGGFLARSAAELVYRVMPNLQTYNVSAIVSRPDGTIPWEYLAGATAQTLVYTGAVLLVGIVLFERTETVSPSDQA